MQHLPPNSHIPSADLITVKQLLNHSSGLKQPTDDDINYQLSLMAPASEPCETDYTSHPDHASYQEALNDYASNSSAPGSVIGVKKQGQPEWIGADGFSNLEYQTAFQPCTPFRCGSITKVFAAVVVMQLIDEEQLTPESTLDVLLPDQQP
jgi:D-alanyl-D-alanine carboxypeptidase